MSTMSVALGQCHRISLQIFQCFRVQHVSVFSVLIPIFVSRFTPFRWVRERGHTLDICMSGNFVSVEKARNRGNRIAMRRSSLAPYFPLTAMKTRARWNGGWIVTFDAPLAVLFDPRTAASNRNLWGSTSLVSARRG